MSEKFLMGLDLGGGGLRCLLVEPESRRIVTTHQAWTAEPDPDAPAGLEYDADATFGALAQVVGAALARAGADRDQILGIGVTSMRHGSALLDAHGREISVAPNRDARGLGAALQMATECGEELHRRTGHWPNPIQPAGRLKWFASERADDLSRATTVLSLSDWLAFRLCGERATDPSQASETLLFELERPEWAWDLIDRFELPREIFPAIKSPGSLLGKLKDAAAAALGLRAGTPVAVGGGDTQCGLLGQGVTAVGALGIVAGSSVPVLQVTDRPRPDADGRLWANHHVIPGRWTLESNGGGAGEALDWIAGLLYPDVDHPILQLLHEASQSTPGSAGLVSSLGAEIMDARDFRLPTGSLTLNYITTAGDPNRRRQLARSIVEGIAYGFRANIEQIESVTGVIAERLRIAGGLSRSSLLCQITCEVLGRPVEVTDVVNSSALGAAICGGVAAGVFTDLEAGAKTLVRVGRSFAPSEARDLYADLYDHWRSLQELRGASDAEASGFAIRAMFSDAGTTTQQASDFRPKILVAADMDEEGLAALAQIGDVEYKSFRESMRLLVGSGLVEALQGVHVFVTEVDVVDAASLLKTPDLRAIAVCRGDAVNVDLEACTALGILVINTPGRNADAVADLALANMLMLARKLTQANAFLRQPGGEAGDMGRMGQAFGTLQGRELWHKTVGLVGLGAVGRKVAERLRPFGARCLVFDPFVDPDAIRVAGAEPATLEELLERSDFVSLHAPVTDQTRGMIGSDELARMKQGSFLVNTARAALLDEDALLAALTSGHLGGAALDVFAVEPPGADDPLLALDNVIATPHVGGNTLEVAAHQGRIVAEDLGRLARGETPRHPLNSEVLNGFRLDQQRPEPAPDLADKLSKGPGPAVSDLQKEKKTEAPKARPRTAPPATSVAVPAATATDAAQVQAIREKMEEILGGFVGAIRDDASLGELAKQAEDVVLHFKLTDLGIQFHFGFQVGTVLGQLGAPDETADVQLKMKADLLDGMFTGRSNAMQAAMNGELSFSGDTAKAMTLSNLQADLSRIYRGVIEQVGEPGDLTALPDPNADPSATAATATPPQPLAAAGATLALSPSEARRSRSSVPADDIRHSLCDIVDELYAAQLITATGGNVSLRIPGSEEAWITPSQLFKGDLAPEILVRIGMDGRAIDEGARSPSSEALMHTAVFQAKPEARAIIHCHAPSATILVNVGLPFLPISTEAAFFQNIGRIPFTMPGTQNLADAVVEAMGDGWAVLMKNHGLLVAGRSLRRAADMAEIIERTCEVILGCHAVGQEPPVLPPDIVETLSKMGDLMA